MKYIPTFILEHWIYKPRKEDIQNIKECHN